MDQVQLLFSFACFQGFKIQKKRKEKREEEINKLDEAVEKLTEVNRNLAQDGQRLLHTGQVSVLARTHAHACKHKDRQSRT